MAIPLPRWVAEWSDGKELVLHAGSYATACDLARTLVAPTGVSLTRVTFVTRLAYSAGAKR